MYHWDFSAVFSAKGLLVQGLIVSLQITASAVVFGLALGFLLAIARLSRVPVLPGIAQFIVEFFRTTPPLIQLFWFYFALPLVIKVEMTPLLASIATLSIQSSAFFSEIFRAGIESVERSQWEAGRAIGMNRRTTLSRIILPQAVKRMIPAFVERSIELFKTTSLVSIISCTDLLYQANEIAQKTYRPLEVYTAVAVIYFVIITVFSQLSLILERRLARSGDSTVH